MPSRAPFIIALLLTCVLGAPACNNGATLVKKQTETERCSPTFGGDGPLKDQIFIHESGIYSDDKCTQETDFYCLYISQETIDRGKGAYDCVLDFDLVYPTPFYMKTLATNYPDIQIAIKRDQSCPPNGAGGVFATLVANPNCVQINRGDERVGAAMYPNGGATFERAGDIKRQASLGPMPCEGFNTGSEEESSMGTQKVSHIISCINSDECEIKITDTVTKTFSTFSSFTAGITVSIVSVSATFGSEYTESESTAVESGFKLKKGQNGYIAADADATLFSGSFTGCSNDGDSSGSVLALRKGSLTYSLVLTGQEPRLGENNGTDIMDMVIIM